MAQITFTVQDALNCISARLGGPQFAWPKIGGQDAAILAISRAQAEVLASFPKLELAGSLAGSDIAFTFSSGVESLPADCYIPKIVTASGYRSVWLPAEEFIQQDLSAYMREIAYAFWGGNAYVKPTTITASTLYYIKVPPSLTATTDAIPLAPRAFKILFLTALVALIQRWKGLEADTMNTLMTEYKDEFNAIATEFKLQPIQELARTTGASPLTGAPLSGQA